MVGRFSAPRVRTYILSPTCDDATDVHLDFSYEGVYTHFIDNHRTAGHQSVVFGLRELGSKDANVSCGSGSMLSSPPIPDRPFNFTSDYELRVYSSGCYYLDAQNRWQSDGLTVRSALSLSGEDDYYASFRLAL